MTNEQIIQMARDAGLEEMWELTPRFVQRLERFAAAVRSATKEEDAMIAAIHSQYPVTTHYDEGYSQAREHAAEAIRASK